jgi:16S rRNA (guanine(966)-N(2))-methyltransferase RsmD
VIRLAAGALKGLSVAAPRGIRPTENLVRQALFNILGDLVVDARVLDGFAGSGALGLEALSRGARRVTFLESDPVCLRLLEQTLRKVPAGVVEGTWEVVRGDAVDSLHELAASGASFDMILLDPPYHEEVATMALRVVGACAILARSGVACLEHAHSYEAPASCGALALMKQHRYGHTVLSFYEAGHQQTMPAATTNRTE